MGLFISETEVAQLKKLSKKKIIPIIIIAIALVVLVVVFAFNNKGKTENKAEKKYLAIDKALSKQEAVLDNKYDNFVLPDSVQKVDTDNLYIITYDAPDVFTQQHKENFVKLMNNFSGKSFSEEDITDDFDLYIYDDDYIGVYTNLHSFDVTKKSSATARISNATGKEEVWHIDKVDMNASYDIGGEQYKVSEVVSDAEKFINENIKGILKPDEGLMLNYIQVCETYGEKEIIVKDENGQDIIYDPLIGIELEEHQKPEETNYFNLIYSLTIDGVPVDYDFGFTDLNEDGYMRGCFLVVTISKKGEIGGVRLSCYFDSTNKEVIDDEILTFESALNMASQHLADYKGYNIVEAGLRYCCPTNFGELKITYRPMWRMVLELYEFGYNGPNILQICVDAVTGEIYFCDNYEGIIKNPTDKD